MEDDLRSWLVQQNHSFIDAFFTCDLKEWVLCVGNEAGDLDTLSCSIAFAYLSSFQPNSSTKYIPIQLTPSSAFQLRAENMAALKDAIQFDHESGDLTNDLICSDTLDFSKFTTYGAKYALVDHNEVISSVFGTQAEVVSVIDHHEPAANNTLYPFAQPRIIQVPTGSCASLVVNYFSPKWQDSSFPIGLANLLLSAIVLDTDNFKPVSERGKATEADMLARKFLLPRSRFASSDSPSLNVQSPHAESEQVTSRLKEMYRHLSDLKSDVSTLNSTQLLQRDYKQYEVNGWKLGLSTVPLGLTEWVHGKEANDWRRLLGAANEYGVSKRLDAVGILTSFKIKKKVALALDQPRHAREMLIMIRDDAMTPIYEGLDHPDESIRQQLDLSTMVIDHQNEVDAFTYSNGVHVKIWKVGNTEASRKQMAPILTRLISQLGNKPLSSSSK